MNVQYVTGNQSKLNNAKAFMEQHGITVSQLAIKIDEIQSDSGIDVAITKAKEAFRESGQPLFINDAEWIIPGLNGFPGPYMKYVVQWLTLEDFLRLTAPLLDRRIILRDTIVYIDENGEKVFTNDVNGTILTEPHGSPKGPFVTQIISLRNDLLSIAEDTTVGFSESEAKLWNDFADWLKTKTTEAR